MECIDPGRVTPDELVAYASGEAGSSVAAHVAACPACKDQASMYARDDAVLGRCLYRFDCPSTQTLGDVALNLLDPDAELPVRQHAALCVHCAGELTLLVDALRADPMEALRPAASRLRRIVAHLLPAPGPGATAYAGVRGAASSSTQTYVANSVSVTLTCEPAYAGISESWTVLGLVVSDDGVASDASDGASIALIQDGVHVAGAGLDDLGNFVVQHVLAGTYVLELTLGDQITAIEDLRIGDIGE